MFPWQTIRSVEVAHKRVLVRVDFNTPLVGGSVADDTRLREALPTLHYLRTAGVKVILLSHLGRPGGEFKREYELDGVAQRLSDLLGEAIVKVDDCVGPAAERAVEEMHPGQVILLENLRFYPEEETNDLGFARKIASLGDLFVLDAFSVAHRAHASTVGIAAYLPAVAGLALEREYEFLTSFLAAPRRPFWALVGGAKVSGKIGVLRRLLQLTDGVAIGGAMANTFLRARGFEIGNSVVDSESLGAAAEILGQAVSLGRPFLLPTDAVVGLRPESGEGRTAAISGVKGREMILDIGPQTVAQFSDALGEARQVVWNGPLGYAENPRFAQGTFKVAEAVASPRTVSLVAGADTIAAISRLGFSGRFTHLSSGGGATLEFLEKDTLPGLEVLQSKER